MSLVVSECRRKRNTSCTGSYLISERTYTHWWQVQTDGSDGAITAKDIELFGENGETPTAGSPLPRYGSLMDSTSGAVLKHKTPEIIIADDVSQWLVRLDYGYIVPEGGAGGSSSPSQNGALDPRQWFPQIRRFTTEIQEPVERVAPRGNAGGIIGGIVGNALTQTLVMSNGRPFLEVPTRSRYLPTVQVVQYESSYSGSTASSVVGSVNSSPFLGMAPRTVLCTAMDGEIDFYYSGAQAIPVYRITYQFTHNKREWTPGRFLSQDFYEKHDSALRPIVVNGSLVTEPWQLDVDGKAVPQDNILSGAAETLTGQPGGFYYVEIPMCEEFNFNLLPLPYTLL